MAVLLAQLLEIWIVSGAPRVAAYLIFAKGQIFRADGVLPRALYRKCLLRLGLVCAAAPPGERVDACVLFVFEGFSAALQSKRQLQVAEAIQRLILSFVFIKIAGCFFYCKDRFRPAMQVRDLTLARLNLFRTLWLLILASRFNCLVLIKLPNLFKEILLGGLLSRRRRDRFRLRLLMILNQGPLYGQPHILFIVIFLLEISSCTSLRNYGLWSALFLFLHQFREQLQQRALLIRRRKLGYHWGQIDGFEFLGVGNWVRYHRGGRQELAIEDSGISLIQEEFRVLDHE